MRPVVPVLGLGRGRVLDVLGREEIPHLLPGAGADGLVVDLHDVRVVRVEYQRVHVREGIRLTLDVILDH